MGIKDLILNKDEASEGCDRKKPNKVIVVILIAAILILAISSFIDGGKKEPANNEEVNKDFSQFAEEEERRLGMILKKINGAGNVSVFISVDDGGEKILARDIKSKTSEEGAKGDSSKSGEDESVVVKVENGSNEKPYIVEERTPEVSGVLVVAEGASSEKVKNEIYDSVKALYGIASHRIKITY